MMSFVETVTCFKVSAALAEADPILASMFLPDCLRGRGWTAER